MKTCVGNDLPILLLIYIYIDKNVFWYQWPCRVLMQVKREVLVGSWKLTEETKLILKREFAKKLGKPSTKVHLCLLYKEN